MSLLPIFNQIIGNSDCIKYNQIVYYSLTSDGITSFNDEFYNLYDIMKSKEIDFRFMSSCNIISEIDKALEANYYIVVGIDNFYEKNRRDFFCKKHNGHSITIFGNDLNNHNYWALEQPFFYSYKYSAIKIEQEDVELGYQSFLENIEKNDFFYNILSSACRINGESIPSSCFISGEIISEDRKDPSYIYHYINRYMKNQLYIFKNLENIKMYETNFEYYYMKCIDDSNGNKSINNLNKLINDKNVERYLFNNILNLKDDFINENNKMINYWNQIRSYISKFVYSKKINREHICMCKYLLREINIMEERYYENILKQMAKIN